MGMYDTVWAPCPDCYERTPFQSKGGSCSLSEYDLEDAPADVLSDANRHVETCRRCGTAFEIKLTITAVVKRKKNED